MEEIIPVLKEMLKKAIEIEYEDSKQSIFLKIKSNISQFAVEPKEVITMFKMFGKMKREIPMDVSINDVNQVITIKTRNREDFILLKESTEIIWDNAVEMLKSVISGDYSSIKDIPNIDD